MNKVEIKVDNKLLEATVIGKLSTDELSVVLTEKNLLSLITSLNNTSPKEHLRQVAENLNHEWKRITNTNQTPTMEQVIFIVTDEVNKLHFKDDLSKLWHKYNDEISNDIP